MEETTSPLRSPKIDIAIWVLISVMVAVAVVANHYFSEVALAVRITLWIILVCALLGLSVITAQGKRLWAFIKDARMELRKVVWPTRDETVKTTAVVAALVFAMSLVLWVIDSILLWIVGWLTR
jgi:preprotein translocase subunit SecE